MLRKLLFRTQDYRQLLIAILGAFIGITFLVTSVHFLVRVNEFGEDSEILGRNILIVQRKVTRSSSFGLTKTDFEKSDLTDMKNESFIDDVQPIVSNNFRVWLETNDKYVPPFRTDAFIQAVNREFLDVHSKKWKWDKNSHFVPIIMPREFIVMLNTFMSASGIPQVSDELAMSIFFKIRISNGKTEEWYDAKIIGFTNQISALLVPEEFMKYANDKFAAGQPGKITQLMIAGKEGKFGELEQYMEDHGMESKNDQMVASRLKSIVGTLLGVITGVSVIALIMSGLVLLQYLQLLISNNYYEIRTLLRQGFHPNVLIKSFSFYFMKLFAIVASIGFAAFILLKMLVDRILTSGGITLKASISKEAIFALIISLLLFAIASFWTARKGVMKWFNA